MGKMHPVAKPKRHFIGRRAVAAIAAVEGLTLSEESRERLRTLRRSGLSPAERRAAILAVYRSATPAG